MEVSHTVIREKVVDGPGLKEGMDTKMNRAKMRAATPSVVGIKHALFYLQSREGGVDGGFEIGEGNMERRSTEIFSSSSNPCPTEESIG